MSIVGQHDVRASLMHRASTAHLVGIHRPSVVFTGRPLTPQPTNDSAAESQTNS